MVPESAAGSGLPSPHHRASTRRYSTGRSRVCDAFGVHGVGGISGALLVSVLLTSVFAAPSLGGAGIWD
jgi:ammonia channel protein AmtB